MMSTFSMPAGSFSNDLQIVIARGQSKSSLNCYENSMEYEWPIDEDTMAIYSIRVDLGNRPMYDGQRKLVFQPPRWGSMVVFGEQRGLTACPQFSIGLCQCLEEFQLFQYPKKITGSRALSPAAHILNMLPRSGHCSGLGVPQTTSMTSVFGPWTKR